MSRERQAGAGHLRAAGLAGDYAEDTIRIREGNLNAFLLFLEGKFNPATDKHKAKQAG